MTEQNDDKQEFRVVDKRRFTNEGDTKTGAGEGTAEKEERRMESKPAAPQPKPKIQESPPTRPPQGGGEEGFDFSSLIISLATQALVMMGEVPNPESHSVNINLDAAKQTIDILSLLEVKTKGNLTAEEEHLLAEVLTNIRLAFVNKVEKKR